MARCHSTPFHFSTHSFSSTPRQFSSDFRIDDRFWLGVTDFAWSGTLVDPSLKLVIHKLSTPKPIVNLKKLLELACCGADCWISNRSKYPPLHLDYRAINAVGVGTYGVRLVLRDSLTKSKKAGIGVTGNG
ncbi:hypothetical protein AVEN_177451-1 [Araneus ventricosus]|uniref:Uncharacterized protein n=1 Tax=Araneus ventricosus TaxID=182803 RepID=A0A4Y2QAS1_ARAVE|nr:hypothetical protein AVEN_177451-1 [Araneus ventricosus]